MQNIVKANPDSAQLFYESLKGIIDANTKVILNNNTHLLQNANNIPNINNPQNVRAKGRKSNKRKTSTLEQPTSSRKKTQKVIINYNVM